MSILRLAAGAARSCNSFACIVVLEDVIFSSTVECRSFFAFFTYLFVDDNLYLISSNFICLYACLLHEIIEVEFCGLLAWSNLVQGLVACKVARTSKSWHNASSVTLEFVGG